MLFDGYSERAKTTGHFCTNIKSCGDNVQRALIEPRGQCVTHGVHQTHTGIGRCIQCALRVIVRHFLQIGDDSRCIARIICCARGNLTTHREVAGRSIRCIKSAIIYFWLQLKENLGRRRLHPVQSHVIVRFWLDDP